MGKTIKHYPRNWFRRPKGSKQARVAGARYGAIPPNAWEDIRACKSCYLVDRLVRKYKKDLGLGPEECARKLSKKLNIPYLRVWEVVKFEYGIEFRGWYMAGRYERVMNELDRTGRTEMKVFGNSMVPIIYSGAKLAFESCEEYEVGDIVFCKVKGRYIDAHKIVKKNPNRGYLIANNHGHENGWTRQIYAKVVEVIKQGNGGRS